MKRMHHLTFFLHFLPLVLLLLLFAAALFGQFGASAFTRDAQVKADPPYTGSLHGPSRVIVMLHGLNPTQERWTALAHALSGHGEVALLRYHAVGRSNANPRALAQSIADEIDRIVGQRKVEVVLLAHSMGAPLARQALLYADAQQRPWARRVSRIVLLAGVARGWSLSDEPPPDASGAVRLAMRVAYWGARLLGAGGLLNELQRGAPFIADLRLQWMDWMRGTERPLVVQLLGDIDDVVHRDDNEDLRTMAAHRYVMMMLRGTGHGDVVDIGADAKPGSEQQRHGQYRRDKIELAVTGSPDQLQRYNEALPPAHDTGARKIVFVLHGIRDLGRWSADFERSIRADPEVQDTVVRVVSPRYGYFGMGPFLLENVRERHVRWLMDIYTETLARYPGVDPRDVHFFAHSNGSYLLARALQTYPSMKVGRVVLAGSVLPRNFAWHKLGGQVQHVRNYVGSRDWVVALFPRFFELPLVSSFGNDIGSAGFNGFDDAGSGTNGPMVDNVRWAEGAHGAFDKRVDEIVAFLAAGSTQAPALDPPSRWGVVLGSPVVVVAVWLLLAAMVVFTGIRVVSAAPSPAWPVLLLFLLLVVRTLQST